MTQEQIAFEKEFKRPESVDFKGGEYIVNEKLHVRANSWFDAQVFIAQWKAWQSARYAGGGEAVKSGQSVTVSQEGVVFIMAALMVGEAWHGKITDELGQALDYLQGCSTRELYTHPAPAVPEVPDGYAELLEHGAPYVLQKNGMYYAHNNCGYVSRALMAELYTKEYAENYAQKCEEVRAMPVTDLLVSADEVQEYIDRMLVMKAAMLTASKEGQ